MNPDELAPALAAVLQPSLGAVTVSDLRVLTGGASRATWAFTAVDGVGSRDLILRIGPPDEIHAGMELEAAALTRAAATGAPVPHVLIAQDSAAALGNPFLVCEAADRAMQIHGGLGYSRHEPFEHIYRHHRRYRITEGAEEIQIRRVAQRMFKFGRS